MQIPCITLPVVKMLHKCLGGYLYLCVCTHTLKHYSASLRVILFVEGEIILASVAKILI